MSRSKGRPMKSDVKRMRVTVTMNKRLMNVVDGLCERLGRGVSRSEMVHFLMLRGLISLMREVAESG